jgi:membrane protease subunit (stomatin/prohibitin family)
MTIDDAIKGFETFAELLEVEKDFLNDSEISEEMEKQKQLAEWLKELKSFKEKDEAKAVCYEGDGYADGKMVYDTAFCPSCEHEFEEDSENWTCDFCPNCGQRLRWEE